MVGVSEKLPFKAFASGVWHFILAFFVGVNTNKMNIEDNMNNPIDIIYNILNVPFRLKFAIKKNGPTDVAIITDNKDFDLSYNDVNNSR
jgi:hypothetical protein